jgi:hypothetical protein
MKVLGRVVLGALFLAGLLAVSAVDSSAYTADFGQITTNSGAFYDFTAEVNDLGGTVQFVFSAPAGTISEVYFDDAAGVLGTFTGLYTGTSAGVEFEVGADPANLPAGNTISPPFNVTDSFQATSQANGVDFGEFLGIVFNLTGTYGDVTDALDDGSLRLGLHVQDLLNGNSESFVTPIPGALLLFGSGLVGLVGIGRRKFRT